MSYRIDSLNLSADSTIYSGDLNANYGLDNTIVFGNTTGGWQYRSLIIIDLTFIPKLSEIVQADLILPIVNISSGTNPIPVYAYTISPNEYYQFNETSVTWRTINGTHNWTELGVIRTGQVPVSQTTVNSYTTEVYLDITEAIYDYHKGRLPNLGFVIATDQQIPRTITCHSRHSNTPPQLEIIHWHHETLNFANKERWQAVVYGPDNTIWYDGNLEYAPEEIEVKQELPIEELTLYNGHKQIIIPWKGTEASSYSKPFNTNILDGYMFERSTIAREITLRWNVKNQRFANLWQVWTDFGAIVYLYPGKRYDPVRTQKAILGLDGYNVWADWPWIDPDQPIRLWKNNIEIYNNFRYNPNDNWSCEAAGGRWNENRRQYSVDHFEYLCHHRLCLRPIEVIPAYYAGHLEHTNKKITSLQVVCLELDFGNRQFGIPQGGYS